MSVVCIAEDDFTRERRLANVRWEALLADGTRVIQDDGRPGEVRSAWLRLADFVRDRRLAVTGFLLRWRDEPPCVLPDNAGGYFFRTAAGSFWGGDRVFRFYLVGWLEGGKVRVFRIQVPEMALVGQEERDPDDPETVGPSLIRNPR